MRLQLVLLDRDGVINRDSADYIKSAEEWQALPGALEAIAELQKHFQVVVCSNQSGIGRGLFDEAALAQIHDKMNTQLRELGGQALDVFYCPHHPNDRCRCRKPSPELLNLAMQSFGVRPEATVYAGDSEKDLIAAANADCHSALILTGNGHHTATTPIAQQAEFTCDSLAALPAALGVSSAS